VPCVPGIRVRAETTAGMVLGVLQRRRWCSSPLSGPCLGSTGSEPFRLGPTGRRIGMLEAATWLTRSTWQAIIAAVCIRC
jgi:hypothetical protein